LYIRVYDDCSLFLGTVETELELPWLSCGYRFRDSLSNNLLLLKTSE